MNGPLLSGPLLELLEHALTDAPERISAVRVDGTGVLRASSRHNSRRPGSMKVAVPDSWVRNVRGRRGLRDAYLLVKIPREVVEAWEWPGGKPHDD